MIAGLVLAWAIDTRAATVLNVAAAIVAAILLQTYLHLRSNSTGRLHHRFFAHVFFYAEGIDSDVLNMELDGKLSERFRGNSDNSLFTLPPGHHRVKFSCRNASVERDLDIQEGMTIKVVAEGSSISLTTLPPKSVAPLSRSETRKLRLRMIAIYLLINFLFALIILRILRMGGVF